MLQPARIPRQRTLFTHELIRSFAHSFAPLSRAHHVLGPALRAHFTPFQQRK